MLALTLLGMFLFRRFLAERPITTIIAGLTHALTLLYLPNIALFYSVHLWTRTHTGGYRRCPIHCAGRYGVGIASGADRNDSDAGLDCQFSLLKATYFAVMAAFVNLALSLSQLLTKALKQWFLITREVKDASGMVTVSADYIELGGLLITVMLLGLALPMLAIFIAKRTFLTE